MNIRPQSPNIHGAHLSQTQSTQAKSSLDASKFKQAGHFLSRSVKSLGNTLKSGFTSTYQWAKKTGSDLFGPTTPLSESDKKYSIDRMKDAGLL